MRKAFSAGVNRPAAWLAPLLLLCGCGGTQVPAAAPVPAATAALVPTFVSLAAAAKGHTLSFRITAPNDRPLYLENCNGAIPWGLEHQRAAAWEPAWVAEIDGCHSAPIKVAAGTSREFHERVSTRPGSTLHAGPYRVAVYGLYFTHDSPHDHALNAEVPHQWSLSPPFRFEP